MTERSISTFNKRLNKLKIMNISIADDITPECKIRGVYGFFAKNETNNICFYIGKSNNIFIRMLGRNSHLNNYLRGVRNTNVHKYIEYYLNNGFNVEIRVLQKVEYVGDSFERDANRLALAELEELVKHQDMEECPNQLSEAVKEKNEREEWESIFNTKLNR